MVVLPEHDTWMIVEVGHGWVSSSSSSSKLY